MYFANGQEKYVGTFASGESEGKGTLYNEEGTVIAQGIFENGVPILQEVVLKDEEGNLLYEGTVNSENKYEGTGLLYKEGELIYEGSFVNGEEEGSGLLFDTKMRTIYEGILLAGKRRRRKALQSQSVSKRKFTGDERLSYL